MQQTALLYTNVAMQLLTALYVPLVPLIGAFLLRRHVPINIWPAVLLSMVGSFFLAPRHSTQFGDLLIIGGFFWAGHILLIQHVLERSRRRFNYLFINRLSRRCWRV